MQQLEKRCGSGNGPLCLSRLTSEEHHWAWATLMRLAGLKEVTSRESTRWIPLLKTTKNALIRSSFKMLPVAQTLTSDKAP